MGPPAIGKTTLAKLYARQQSQYDDVLWFNCSSYNNALESFQQIQYDLFIPPCRAVFNQSEDSSLQTDYTGESARILVSEKISNSSNFLIILDDAEDLDLVSGLFSGTELSKCFVVCISQNPVS
jgi:hypothetical protein